MLAKCSVLILKQVVALGSRRLMTGYLKIVVEVGVLQKVEIWRSSEPKESINFIEIRAYSVAAFQI